MNHRQIEVLACQAARVKQAIADHIKSEREEGTKLTLTITLRERVNDTSISSDVLAIEDIVIIEEILTDALDTLEYQIKHETGEEA